MLQVSRSQVNRVIMMTKEKDPEILCDLVVSGNVFHAGIDQDRADIVSKSPPSLRGSGPPENQERRLDIMHINRFPLG